MKDLSEIKKGIKVAFYNVHLNCEIYKTMVKGLMFNVKGSAFNFIIFPSQT